MFRIIGDIIRLIKDAILFILKLGWKLLIIAVVIGAIIFGIKGILHL